MSGVNRRPGLLSELREIRRRLGRLEAASPRTPPPTPATAPHTDGPVRPTGALTAPLLPARPRDWYACDAAEWETVLHARWEEPAAGGTAAILLAAVASPDTEGEVRCTADGAPVGPPLPVGPAQTRTTRTIALAGLHNLRIEARRTTGNGELRLVSTLL